ncbi:MAG: hypothetical protein ABSD44_12620 [Terracidiphilus sp.]
MRKHILAFVFLAICPLLVAQQTMNNDSVIKLVKAGLSDDLIVSTINGSTGTYNTSADGIIALKTAGASDKVVTAIVAKASASALPPAPVAAAAASTAAAGTDPDDPTAAHEAGIYIYNDSAPTGSKMTLLEPNVYTQGKTGGVFASAMTYGIAKVKMKAVLRGAHANARVSDPQPVFYFYFEKTGAGLSNASGIFASTTTPNEYTLLKFDVKGETRETVIGSMNAFGGSGGTDDKAVTNFTYTRLRPGVYKVILNAALQPGEYGFISSGGSVAVGPMGSTTNSRVFDFGRN